MVIVQINSIYKEKSTGRTCYEIEKELECKYGFKVYTACKTPRNGNDHVITIGNVIDYKIHALFSRIFGKQGYFSYFSTIFFLKILKEIKPNVVHLRNLHANYINIPLLLKYLKKNNIPTVITLHDCFLFTGKCVYPCYNKCKKYQAHCGKCPQLKNGNRSWFFDRTTKMLFDKNRYLGQRNNIKVVGVSKWVTDEAKKSILDYNNNLTTIYNWIDTEIFKPFLQNDLDYMSHNTPIVLGVSSYWSKEKGYYEFCKIANILGEKAAVFLVGNVSKVEYKKNITYLGNINDSKKLAQLYSLATVFVNPSRMETFGKVSAEAMSCGTPVVAYDYTANREIVGEGCGYILDKNNAEDACDKILTIISKGKSFYSSNCINYVKKNFDKSNNIKKYLEIYKGLLRE